MTDRAVVTSAAVGDAFKIDLSRQRECLVASVAGEIDLATAPDLLRAVESGLVTSEPNVSHVVVDLSEVPFLDSSGLNAFVRLAGDLARRGMELRLVSPTDRVVRQVFEITKLTEELRVVGTLDDALS